MPSTIDCFGFAGGMTLGVVQSGWTLVGKRETSDFGVANMEANRHLLGYGWETQTNVHEWEPLQVDMVHGNPPCSGFSLMSSKATRGIDAKVNACMWQLVHYAAECDPSIVAFESVQGAFTQGRPLMQALRLKLEELSGHRYGLWHVKHDAYALGGCAIRRRYFWVASRVPFGVEPVELTRFPTFWDAIGDCADLEQRWSDQPYLDEASWWAAPVRRADGLVDGHMQRNPDASNKRLQVMLEEWYENWSPGENINDILKRHYHKHGEVPDVFKRWEEKLVEKDFNMGFYPETRSDPTKPARVMTGAALSHLIHPTRPRLLTHREVARVMGFPDDWRINPLREVKGLDATWGKGISTQCGRWLGEWTQRSLEGEPGQHPQEEIGDREWLVEVKRPANLTKLLDSQVAV